jgi:hypothetical protein
MGAGVSASESPAQLQAFAKVKAEYEANVGPAIASGNLTEEEGMEKLRHMYANLVASIESGESKGESPRRLPPGAPLPSTAEVKIIKEMSLIEGDRTRDESTYMLSLKVGDVVKVKDSGFFFEGVVMLMEGGKVTVNFGDEVVSDDAQDVEKVFPIEDCFLVMSGLEMEEFDRVEVNTFGNLYCQGVIIAIHRRFISSESIVEVTYDVRMDNEDEADDIEHDVHPGRIRKLMSHRVSAAERWKRGGSKVVAALAFQKMGLLHRQSLIHKAAHMHDHEKSGEEKGQ